MPEDVTVVFQEIKRIPSDIGKPRCVATCFGKEKKIVIAPEIRHCYFAVHIALLHEMAHMYLEWSTAFRHRGHGRIFNAEINRLYALGAFRELI